MTQSVTYPHSDIVMSLASAQPAICPPFEDLQITMPLCPASGVNWINPCSGWPLGNALKMAPTSTSLSPYSRSPDHSIIICPAKIELDKAGAVAN